MRGGERWGRLLKELSACGYTGPLMTEVEARERQGDLRGVLADVAASVRRIGDRVGKSFDPRPGIGA